MKKIFNKFKKTVIVFAALNLFCFSVNADSTPTALELFNKGLAAQNSQNYYNAIEFYREALIQNSTYGEAWYNLALCTYALGDFVLSYEYALEAEKYSRDLSTIKNLEGMSLLAQGELEGAGQIFNEVLIKFPNDVDSRFGLAEINLYEGSISAAENRYIDALKRDQKNRKALLSLALVSAEQGKMDAAERYINQALLYHSGEAEVHYLASYLATLRGDYTEAERRARSAVQIRGDYDDAYELLSQILYAEQRYDEVIDLCDFRIGRNRNNISAWYLKALSLSRNGETERAIQTYTTGLSISPEDEVMRFALEQLVAQSVSIEDSRRRQWASYHISKAEEFNRNFNGEAERYEFQKALSVDPLNLSARQAFADLLAREGLYELYLSQLKFIQENEGVVYGSVQFSEDTPKAVKTPQQIKNADTVEALESMLQNSLPNKWNVDSFYLDKTRWQIGVFYTKNKVSLNHADVDQILATAASDIFSGVSSTAVNVRTEAVSGFGEAYRLARSQNLDYFIIFQADETDRSIQINAKMYSGRTGTQTQDFHIYRTGNDRISSALRRFRSAVLDILPIRGKVLQKVSSTLLVDLGKSDGVEKNTVFDVVRKGTVKTQDTGTGVAYKAQDIIGTFTVTSVSEELCEGTFVKKGFYDTLALGDEVILVSVPESSSLSSAGNSQQELRPQANSEGEAVTAMAETKENQSVKEDLKATLRESTLLRMIQAIQNSL